MLTPQEYLLAWGIYALGAALVMLVGWRWLSWVRPRFLRLVLQGTLAVVIWMPAETAGVAGQWVPASVAVFFGLVTHESVLPQLGPYYVIGVAACALYACLDGVIRWVWRRVAK